MWAGKICSAIERRFGQLGTEFAVVSCDNQREDWHIARLIVNRQFESIFQQRSEEYVLLWYRTVVSFRPDVVALSSLAVPPVGMAGCDMPREAALPR